MGLFTSKKIKTSPKLDLQSKKQDSLQYIINDTWVKIYDFIRFGHMSHMFDSNVLKNIINNELQKDILEAIITEINKTHFANDKIELASLVSDSKNVLFTMKMKPPAYNDKLFNEIPKLYHS